MQRRRMTDRELLEELLRRTSNHGRLLLMLLGGEGNIMTAQESVDAAVSVMGAAVSDLASQVGNISTAQAALDNAVEDLKNQLANAGSSVDTSALDAATAALRDAVGSVDSTVNKLVDDPNIPTQPAGAEGPVNDVPAPNGSDATAEPQGPVDENSPSE